MQLKALIRLGVVLLSLGPIANAQAPVWLGKLSDPDPAGVGELSSFGVSVGVGDGFFVVGDPGDSIFGEEAGAAYVFSGDHGQVYPVPVLLHSTDMGPGLNFGLSVSAFGQRIAVASLIGTCVFRLENDQWVEEARIPYGSSSVSLCGGELAIGTLSWPIGAVVIYRLDPGLDSASTSDDQWVEDSWVFGRFAQDYFGGTVDLDRNHLLVGASAGVMAGTETGLAYVFERASDGSGWIETAKLEPIGATAKAGFGRSVSVRGDLIVVGAPLDHLTPPSSMGSGGSGKGAAYVYRRDPVSKSWKSQGRLVARDGGADDCFGVSVAIGNETILVGAHFAEAGQKKFAGGVYQFAPGPNHDSTARWHFVHKFAPPNVKAGAQFGISMAHGADTMLIGADETAHMFSAN